MKTYTFIFGLIGLLFVMSCKTTDNARISNEKARIGDDFLFTYERTPCYGKCPTFKMEVDRKGNVKFEGIRFVDNVGQFEKKISKKSVKALISTLQQANFWELEDEYDGNVSDLPTVVTTCINNGKEKTVKARFDIPEEVIAMNDSLQNIIGLKDFKAVEIKEDSAE